MSANSSGAIENVSSQKETRSYNQIENTSPMAAPKIEVDAPILDEEAQLINKTTPIAPKTDHNDIPQNGKNFTKPQTENKSSGKSQWDKQGNVSTPIKNKCTNKNGDKKLGSIKIIDVVLLLAVIIAVILFLLKGYENRNEDNFSWSLENGVLNISGYGEMPDYDKFQTPWYDQSGDIKSVVMSDGITSIGDYAFADCYSLKEITFEGTEAEWNAIEKSGNDFGSITITYAGK